MKRLGQIGVQSRHQPRLFRQPRYGAGTGHGLGTSHALQPLGNAVPRHSPRFCISDCGAPMANPVVGAIPVRPTVDRQRTGSSSYHSPAPNLKGLVLIDITRMRFDKSSHHEPEIHGSFECPLEVVIG